MCRHIGRSDTVRAAVHGAMADFGATFLAKADLNSATRRRTTWRPIVNFNRKIRICLIALTATASLPSFLQAQTAGPCLYASKSYSEGASICLRPSLMLSCRAEGARMVWTVVTDQDISRLCSGPVVARFHARSVRTALRRASPPERSTAAAAKCFQFNGRTYCE